MEGAARIGASVAAIAALWLRQNRSSWQLQLCILRWRSVSLFTHGMCLCHPLSTHRRTDDADPRSERSPKKSHSRDRDRRGDGHGEEGRSRHRDRDREREREKERKKSSKHVKYQVDEKGKKVPVAAEKERSGRKEKAARRRSSGAKKNGASL